MARSENPLLELHGMISPVSEEELTALEAAHGVRYEPSARALLTTFGAGRLCRWFELPRPGGARWLAAQAALRSEEARRQGLFAIVPRDVIRRASVVGIDGSLGVLVYGPRVGEVDEAHRPGIVLWTYAYYSTNGTVVELGPRFEEDVVTRFLRSGVINRVTPPDRFFPPTVCKEGHDPTPLLDALRRGDEEAASALLPVQLEGDAVIALGELLSALVKESGREIPSPLRRSYAAQLARLYRRLRPRDLPELPADFARATRFPTDAEIAAVDAVRESLPVSSDPPFGIEGPWSPINSTHRTEHMRGWLPGGTVALLPCVPPEAPASIDRLVTAWKEADPTFPIETVLERYRHSLRSGTFEPAWAYAILASRGDRSTSLPAEKMGRDSEPLVGACLLSLIEHPPKTEAQCPYGYNFAAHFGVDDAVVERMLPLLDAPDAWQRHQAAAILIDRIELDEVYERFLACLDQLNLPPPIDAHRPPGIDSAWDTLDLGHPDFPTFVEYFAAGAHIAVRAVLRRPESRSLAWLRQALRHRDSGVRIGAGAALAKLGHPAGARAMLCVMREWDRE